jgi:hypothetical protein
MAEAPVLGACVDHVCLVGDPVDDSLARRGSENTLVHSPNGRLVVTTSLPCSLRSEMTWRRARCHRRAASGSSVRQGRRAGCGRSGRRLGRVRGATPCSSLASRATVVTRTRRPGWQAQTRARSPNVLAAARRVGVALLVRSISARARAAGARRPGEPRDRELEVLAAERPTVMRRKGSLRRSWRPSRRPAFVPPAQANRGARAPRRAGSCRRARPVRAVSARGPVRPLRP